MKRIPGTMQISAEKTLGSLMEALKESSRWHDEGIEALYLYANIDCMVLPLSHQITACLTMQQQYALRKVMESVVIWCTADCLSREDGNAQIGNGGREVENYFWECCCRLTH
jgi:hypothetical protein